MPTITRHALLLVDDYALGATFTAASETTGSEATKAEFPRQGSAWQPLDFQAARPIIIDLGEARTYNTIACVGLSVSGTGLTPELVDWQVETDDNSGFTSPTDWGAQDYVIRASGGAVPRVGMPQPNLGPTDAQLVACMNASRLHSVHRRTDGAEVSERYIRVTFTHTATPDADQRLRVPKLFVGFPDVTINWRTISEDVIPLGPGETLRAWDVAFEAIVEDEKDRKLKAALIPGRRAFWALEPDDRPEFFLSSGTGGDGNAAMVEIVSASFDNEGVPLSAFAAPDVDGWFISGTLRLVERFNAETAT